MAKWSRWRIPVFTIIALPLIGMAEVRSLGLLREPVAAVTPSVHVTCEGLRIRADDFPGRGHDPFSARLALSCAEAVAALKDGVDANRTIQALALLDRLEEFRRTIAEINHARLRESNTIQSPQRPVSQTGEYLIAREIGLLDAHVSWTGGAGESVAAR